MKHFSLIDIAFFILAGIFLILWGYELLRIFAPYYHFWYAFFWFLSVTIVYLIYKFESQNTLVRNLFDSYIQKRELILTGHLAFTLLILVLSFYIRIPQFVTWSISLFLLHFVFAKIQGYQMDFRWIGKNIDSPTAWRVFFITFAGFIIVCSAMLQSFSLDPTLQKQYLIGASVLYFIGWFLVFFDVRQLFKKKNIGRTELFLVWLLFLLVWYIVFELFV